MGTRNRIAILAAVIVAAAVPIGLVVARESWQTIDAPVALSSHAWWSPMSDVVLLAVAGGLFRGVAALIRKGD
jgi:hypothetical protein